MVEKVLQLKCDCNQYPWGKVGSESLAARLCSKTPGTGFKIDEDSPYAEMWMGTYPDLPSYVLETGEDLQHVLDGHANDLIGETIVKRFKHSKLPYLPKVLSIAKALPLQLHPNKALAAQLHDRNSSQFTDPNHKPEIALALGDFEAFCGFKPLDDIKTLMNLPPLQKFLPLIKKLEFDDQILKHVVKTMLEASDEVIVKTNDALLQLPREAFGKNTYIPDLIPRLSKQYDKCDNGIVVALVTMNYLQLKAGDIIECMARSNNVLNTGFCPRADRDSIDLFCSVLTFSPHGTEEAKLLPRPFEGCKNGKVKKYAPPLSEFNMLAIELPDGESETTRPIGGPTIAIATMGEGMMKADGKEYKLGEGFVYFIAHGTEVNYHATKGLQVYAAFVE